MVVVLYCFIATTKCSTSEWEENRTKFCTWPHSQNIEIKTLKLSDLRPYQCFVLLNFFFHRFFSLEIVLNILIEWKQCYKYSNWCRFFFSCLFFLPQEQFISISYTIVFVWCVFFFLDSYSHNSTYSSEEFCYHPFCSCWCLIKAQSIKLEDKQNIWIRSNMKCILVFVAIVIVIVVDVSRVLQYLGDVSQTVIICKTVYF